MSDIIILRANILGGMNEYLKELNIIRNRKKRTGLDEFLDLWYNEMYPLNENKLMEIAQDTELFNSLTTTFSKIIAFYC